MDASRSSKEAKILLGLARENHGRRSKEKFFKILSSESVILTCRCHCLALLICDSKHEESIRHAMCIRTGYLCCKQII